MSAGADRRAAMRGVDNTIHDLIAIANDLRRHIRADLAAQGYAELRPSFAPLLSRIWSGGVPQGRLAEAMGVSPQAASQTVGLAEQAGYVTREPNPDDRRSKLVVLTDAGRAFVADGGAAIAARAAAYAAVVGSRPFARFDGALARLRTGLGIAADAGPVASLTPRTSIITVSVLADQAMATLREAMDRSGHGAISGSQNLVLVYVGPDGARSSDLARAQQVSRQAVTATLHELESLGYVTRGDDAADARGVVFRPTARGRAVLRAYVAGIDDLETRYAAILGPARFATMAATARELAGRIQVHRALDAVLAADAGGDRSSGPRSQQELGLLAVELLGHLGAADALRLAGLLGEAALERRRPPVAALSARAAPA